MKVRVIKKTTIGGNVYYPSPEIMEVWPTDARKGIIKGELEDIEGNFIKAWNAKEAYKNKIEKRKTKNKEE